jgi:hypothetical protein
MFRIATIALFQEAHMPIQGWKRLFSDTSRFQGEGNYPIQAYSEFMPPPRVGIHPYGDKSSGFFSEEDLWGWPVTEYEEAFELAPGMESIGRQVLGSLVQLGRGSAAHGISKNKLIDNPCWPEELAVRAGSLAHERYVLLLPLALSCTQDDKGRVRWTLFGSSEQGPEKAFWKSFYRAPNREIGKEQVFDFFRRLLHAAYGVPLEQLADLHAAGFRIFSADSGWAASTFGNPTRPRWTSPFLWTKGNSLREVKYMLCFEAFSALPASVRSAYLSGKLHLLPFPGSLLFWGTPSYLRLRRELPLAAQIPLLHLIARHEGPQGLRVPQSGWMHEPRPGESEPDHHRGPVRNTYIRTHRWAKVHRHQDEIALLAREDKLAHVLFSTEPSDIDLYGKPMARNVQIWTHDYRLLLDGPRATAGDIERAFVALGEGGLFGYRFLFPAMRVGTHEIYWHRPLAACLPAGSDEPAFLSDAPMGYVTCYPAERPDLSRPLELWPRLLRREAHQAAAHLFEHSESGHPHQTALNARKLLEAGDLLGKSVARTFARCSLSLPKHGTLEKWLESLPRRAQDHTRGRALKTELENIVGPASPGPALGKGNHALAALTFKHTAKRSFEVEYWETIRYLSEGQFINKCNADCVRDTVTQQLLQHHHRDLEALGNYLLEHYHRTIAACGMKGKALAGELPFRWKTDFDFDWYGGWLHNQEETAHERNLMVVIPGRNRREAVIMADHYDTAYMEDFYYKERGGSGARLAAAGADDNHSATAALMLAAPIFCKLSCEGRLGCDVWLIHLTGEEFPSDCMGARRLCQQVVEGTLQLHLAGGARREFSRTRIRGVYVLDMVAHNNDHERDVFQMAPGTGRESAWLAYQAHCANEIWNASVAAWNRRPSRRGCTRGRRSPDGATIPKTALHPQLLGEVRPHYDPRSTLYNTDGQIFSDAGVPVVLFMENYDINRTGYHDSHDTMANIDLDYGAAVVSIAIEAVARAASPIKNHHQDTRNHKKTTNKTKFSREK